jgi:hypothetical protein
MVIVIVIKNEAIKCLILFERETGVEPATLSLGS